MFIYCEAAVCVLSILIKGGLYCYYKKLIKDSRNMANARSSMLKKIKESYECEYNNSRNIENINMFVYKCMFEVRILGMKISTWEAIGILNVLVCAVLGGAAALKAFMEGYDDQYIIMNIMCGFVSGFLIVLSDLAANIQNKVEHLHVNICLYIENEMKPALERKHISNRESVQGVSDEIDAGIVELFRLMNESKDNNKSRAAKRELKKPAHETGMDKSGIEHVVGTQEEEEIIKDVIEEYLA